MSIGVVLAANKNDTDTDTGTTAAPGFGNYVDAVTRQAREAAEAGLRSVWFGQPYGYDAAALAGIVGREVPGVEVGTAAVPVFGRHPLLLAGQAQTAQAATHGRFHLGLALGSKVFTETAFGLPYERPIARLREFLTALRTLLETGGADFHGELLTTAPTLPVGLPGSDPRVPLLVAAMGPQALRVSGELADGILPYLAGPRTLGEHIVPAVTSAAAGAGRPAPRIVAFVAGALASDPESARAAAARQMAFYDQVPSYQRVLAQEGVERAADLAVIGDENTLTAAVRGYFDAGATDVVFTRTDLAGEADRERTVRFLGSLRREPVG
ncbi:TIGR03564 family F420-dependent LLM class oxidoreductase [Streptomyces arenae]|uniref:TIGR03564 family F420-dependent LLM class oxidoreductase n=1 Tax=Streptomyces arenae TaxID=29301 RepID=UPI00265A12B3|nr:TIGR03564 family F420-dependent LLM class oxidoreductase [Streptomyces arenae]MCG7209786.1 TIGR03564 family F420-dependent LLM class oxidoreductase [Streptomyces arenae]